MKPWRMACLLAAIASYAGVPCTASAQDGTDTAAADSATGPAAAGPAPEVERPVEPPKPPPPAVSPPPAGPAAADVSARPFPFPGPALTPLVFHSPDERFTLRIGAQIQFRYQASDADNEADRQTFIMRQVRPQIRGSLGTPWLTYFIQPELGTSTPRLLDLELTAQPIPEIGLKIGQFLTPFSRTFYTPVPKLLFPDFSIANDAFRADRDTGVMLSGAAVKGLIEYYAGVFNGNRINKNGNDDAKLMYVGRVAFNPLGEVSYDETATLAGPSPFKIALGINAYRGQSTQVSTDTTATPPTTTTSRDDNITAGADLALRYAYATLQAEAYYRSAKPSGGASVKARGGYVHASCFVLPTYVELATRVSYVDPNEDASGDRTYAYEGMLTLYGFANNLKLNLRYERFDRPKADRALAGNVFSAQLQAFF